MAFSLKVFCATRSDDLARHLPNDTPVANPDKHLAGHAFDQAA
ncbi:hypothetical protein RBSH_05572 [Rhodopirellula baltica SH28]|uniref:Uncharacterized protein n=1 Tax=Rhodopirellula baltica SH28 TaxID=993517 RepID=K5E048_RHOBT|nr:hypothetical protein RBSH_05572 [Rhodopirellula baltica SH28]